MDASRPSVCRPRRGHLGWALYAVLVSSFAITSTIAGAELVTLTLRSDVVLGGGWVRVADVAEVHAADAVVASQVAALTIAPAPVETGTLTASEIDEILTLRGLPSGAIRFAGAETVQMTRLDDVPVGPHPSSSPAVSRPASRPLPPRPQVDLKPVGFDAPGRLPAGQSAPRALTFLTEPLDRGSVTAWNSPAASLASGGASAPASTSSRTAPGPSAPTPAASSTRQLKTPVSRRIIVATATLAARTIVTREHLAIVERAIDEPGVAVALSPEKFESLLGQETIRSLRAGQPIEADHLLPPVVIARNEVVTVTASIGGVTVRTTGKALSDGRMGELIAIQKQDSRDRLQGRIIGPKTVAIDITSPTATPMAGRITSPRPGLAHQIDPT